VKYIASLLLVLMCDTVWAVAPSNSQVLSQIPTSYQLTPAETAANVTPVNYGYPPGNVFRYMTIAQLTDVLSGVHSIDDSAAIQNAVNVGGKVIVPPYIFRLASGITVTTATMISGDAMQPYNAPSGSEFLCDLSVTTCLSLNTSVGVGVENLIIGRAAGTPPTGSIGLKVQTYNPTIRNVFSLSHAIGFYFGSSGIAAYVSNIYTGAITDAHVVVDSWPELRIAHSRFGMNGGGDVISTTYIRLKGGSVSNPSSGPNTLILVSDQFNQGANYVSHWIEWVSQLSGSIADTGNVVVDDSYIEGVHDAYLYSDSSWTTLSRLQLTNNLFNSPYAPNFTVLNSATSVLWWQWDNNHFTGPVTFAPHALASPGSAVLVSHGNFYSQGFTITGPDSNFDFVSGGDDYAGGLSLQGTYRYLKVHGSAIGATDTSVATTKSLDFTDDFRPNHITVTAASGSNAIDVEGSSAGPNVAFQYTDHYVGAGSIPTVSYDSHLNTNGFVARYSGNGATNKYVRVSNGHWSIINNAFSTVLLDIDDSGNTIVTGNFSIANRVLFSITMPTVSSGGGTSPSVQGVTTGAFQITEGTGSPGTALTLTMPAAISGWNCQATDVTTGSVGNAHQTADSTTSVTMTFGSAPSASDKVRFVCGAW
jgi:hypothetical protein